jgi:MinD superfamily P-loop ATPase
MAGVENIITQQELKRLKQKKDIDYNKEVPFKRDVPDFVFKTEST